MRLELLQVLKARRVDLSAAQLAGPTANEEMLMHDGSVEGGERRLAGPPNNFADGTAGDA